VPFSSFSFACTQNTPSAQRVSHCWRVSPSRPASERRMTVSRTAALFYQERGALGLEPTATRPLLSASSGQRGLHLEAGARLSTQTIRRRRPRSQAATATAKGGRCQIGCRRSTTTKIRSRSQDPLLQIGLCRPLLLDPRQPRPLVCRALAPPASQTKPLLCTNAEDKNSVRQTCSAVSEHRNGASRAQRGC
jgi:hypothetical protein